VIYTFIEAQKANPPDAIAWPNSSKKIQEIVNLTTLLDPPAKSQLSSAFHSAYQKQPIGGCEEKEVALMRRITVVLGLVLALLVALGVVGIAIAAVPTDTSALRNAVTVDGIMEHERAFQNIADLNGGTRVAPPPGSDTSGYDDSAAYVVEKLKAAGYKDEEVTVQKFSYPFFQELTPTTFSQTAPTAKAYVDGTGEGTDIVDENTPGYFHIMSYSGSADVVDAPVVPTNDIQIPPRSTANSSTSGCEASDFVPASETEPQVALIQRGGGAPRAATSRRKR
jgi:hypothetical protein